jgi:hypothetical protein
LVHDTSMPSGLNLSATGLSVAATKGVGTTMSTTSQLDATEHRSPVAVKLPGHLWPGGGHTRSTHTHTGRGGRGLCLGVGGEGGLGTHTEGGRAVGRGNHCQTSKGQLLLLTQVCSGLWPTSINVRALCMQACCCICWNSLIACSSKAGNGQKLNV